MNGPDKKVVAVMMIEVLGRPKEHLIDTLNSIVDKIKKESGIRIVEFKINESKEVEKQKDLFSNFVEMELELNSAELLFPLIFKYMPSNIEIIEPENLRISNNSLSELLNELTRKLHQYDELARVIQMEKQILENKLKELQGKK